LGFSVVLIFRSRQFQAVPGSSRQFLILAEKPTGSFQGDDWLVGQAVLPLDAVALQLKGHTGAAMAMMPWVSRG